MNNMYLNILSVTLCEKESGVQFLEAFKRLAAWRNTKSTNRSPAKPVHYFLPPPPLSKRQQRFKCQHGCRSIDTKDSTYSAKLNDYKLHFLHSLGSLLSQRSISWVRSVALRLIAWPNFRKVCSGSSFVWTSPNVPGSTVRYNGSGDEVQWWGVHCADFVQFLCAPSHLLGHVAEYRNTENLWAK